VVLRALLDMKAKCFGNKSIGGNVARTGTWCLKTSWECSYFLFKMCTVAFRHIEIGAF
jgi:hypothetical protein